MNDIKLAILGNKEAAKRLTDAGVMVPCWRCGSHKQRRRKMKSEEFERLEALAAETKCLRNALRRYESALASQTLNFTRNEEKRDTDDYGTIAAHRAVEIARRVLEMEREMVELIDGVPKPHVRKIMRWRYIRGRSWGQIAHEMGYADSAAPYRVLLRFRKKYVKSTGK